MPISHLLTDSFFQEQNERHQQQHRQRLTNSKSLPSSATAAPITRQVRFDSEDQFFDDELFKESGMDSTADHFGIGNESPTAPYSPTDFEDYNQHLFLDEEIAKLNLKHDESAETRENPVLIDTDGGIYDAWALSLLLRKIDGMKTVRTDFQLVGITTVNGATTVDKALKNVCRVLQESGKTHNAVPIYKGMESSILTPKGALSPRPVFFGSDGLGDPTNLPALKPYHSFNVKQDHGVNAIIKMAEKYKGSLTILAIGPLTNLAMAVKLKPEIKNFIKQIFIVGGNVDGVGNMTVAGEFNFFTDPESAKIVLESFQSCPIYLLPWETCLTSTASTHEFRTNIVGSLGTPLSRFFNTIEGNILKENGDQWMAPDALLVACFLNSEVIRKTENYHCTVEVQGKHTRGMMVVDKNFLRQNPANVTIITEVDRPLFENMLVEVIAEGKEKYNNGQNHVNDQRQHEQNIKMEQNYF